MANDSTHVDRLFRFGSVGRPLPGVEVAAEEGGELLIRGKIFAEYFRNEVATRDALSEDGFYRTCDIGHVDADGFWARR